MVDARVPGWYGKLPTIGDFASRRLEPAWIAAWDDWLADGLSTLRERLGDAWLAGYLASPPWRFVLSPGVLNGIEGAWAGVLMASVDRVGRYFPLTIAAPLGTLPTSASALDALLGWLHQLEDAAADALHDDWDIERLEAELAAHCVWPQADRVAEMPNSDAGADDTADAVEQLRRLLDRGQGGTARAPESRAELIRLFSEGVVRRGQTALEGTSFWLAAAEQQPRLTMTRGLPDSSQFAALFDSASRSAP
jgi:type VI secretion system protein ImpM